MTPRQQIIAELDRQCRKVEQDPYFDDIIRKRPVQWGPLTPRIAKALGWTYARVRRHLDAEVALGRVVRSMPFQSTVRWWILEVQMRMFTEGVTAQDIAETMPD